MQFILDHIASIMIGGVILLILLSLSFRGQDATHDATMYYTAKASMLSLAEWIEQDFKNIGSGHNPPATSIVRFDTTGVTKGMLFWAQTAQGQPADSIRYDWKVDGTAEIDAGTVQLYTVRRWVDGVLTGWSEDVVTDIDIRLLRADSTVAAGCGTACADVRQIHVRLKAISPLGVGELIEQTSWSKVFRPVNLTRPAP